MTVNLAVNTVIGGHAAGDVIANFEGVYGSVLGDTLAGTSGINVLLGLGGNDILTAAAAACSTAGTAATRSPAARATTSSTSTIEAVGGGSDTLYSAASFGLAAGAEVEMLSAISHAAADAINLTGNAFANTLIGNVGSNLLVGGGGADTLYGLDGADIFAFNSAPGAGNVDAVMDFVAGSDKLALDDAVFAGLAPGALPPSAFILAGGSGDANYRVVYNPATGALFFDADGTGAAAAVQFATLAPGLGLAASDFMVI